MRSVIRFVESVACGWARVRDARNERIGGETPRELYPFVELACPHGFAHDVACDLVAALRDRGVDLHRQPAEGPCLELRWTAGDAEAVITLWAVDDAELADPGAEARAARARARADAAMLVARKALS